MSVPQPPMRLTPPTAVTNLTPCMGGEVVAAGWSTEEGRPAVFVLVDYEADSQYLVALGQWQHPPAGSEHVITWHGPVFRHVVGGSISEDVTFHVWRCPPPDAS